jgi:hypothetical protein
MQYYCIVAGSAASEPSLMFEKLQMPAKEA